MGLGVSKQYIQDYLRYIAFYYQLANKYGFLCILIG